MFITIQGELFFHLSFVTSSDPGFGIFVFFVVIHDWEVDPLEEANHPRHHADVAVCTNSDHRSLYIPKLI